MDATRAIHVVFCDDLSARHKLFQQVVARLKAWMAKEHSEWTLEDRYAYHLTKDGSPTPLDPPQDALGKQMDGWSPHIVVTDLNFTQGWSGQHAPDERLHSMGFRIAEAVLRAHPRTTVRLLTGFEELDIDEVEAEVDKLRRLGAFGDLFVYPFGGGKAKRDLLFLSELLKADIGGAIGRILHEERSASLEAAPILYDLDIRVLQPGMSPVLAQAKKKGLSSPISFEISGRVLSSVFLALARVAPRFVGIDEIASIVNRLTGAGEPSRLNRANAVRFLEAALPGYDPDHAMEYDSRRPDDDAKTPPCGLRREWIESCRVSPHDLSARREDPGHPCWELPVCPFDIVVLDRRKQFLRPNQIRGHVSELWAVVFAAATTAGLTAGLSACPKKGTRDEICAEMQQRAICCREFIVHREGGYALGASVAGDLEEIERALDGSAVGLRRTTGWDE